jgi:hypothetical protein
MVVGGSPDGGSMAACRAVLSDDLKRAEERRAMMATGWLFLTVLLVLWLGRRALGKREAPPSLPPLRMWHEAVGWLLFSALWTWPAVTAGPNIVGRHFDALGTVWVIDAATRLGLTLHDTMTVWPTGVTYSAIDSWVLLPLSWLGSMLSAPAVHGWIQVLGVALTGFAASRFARVVGAHSPFDLVAGLFFMGSGLTAAALLEGHVYQVFNPWMPLMGMYLWLASRPDAHWKHGVWAGVFFALSLFTSGYIGLAAGLVGLGLGIPVVLRPTRRGPILLAGVSRCVRAWCTWRCSLRRVSRELPTRVRRHCEKDLWRSPVLVRPPQKWTAQATRGHLLFHRAWLHWPSWLGACERMVPRSCGSLLGSLY